MSDYPDQWLPHEFRFFLACRSIGQPRKDLTITLNQVIDRIPVIPNEPLDIVAVVGLQARQSSGLERLYLFVSRLRSNGEDELVDGFEPLPLECPATTKPVTMTFPVKIPIDEPGSYCFTLCDVEGVFGRPGWLLAIFPFEAVASDYDYPKSADGR